LPFTVDYGKQFAIEFKNYPLDQQNAIVKFALTFQEHGLFDFSKYEGKISQSWKGIEPTDPLYNYAFSNNLWHYHVGIPDYKPSKYGNPYLTSDYVLHFQRNSSTHITLVDILFHYHADGRFHLPSEKYLEKDSDEDE
jgi:hypothetical protein